MGSIQTYKDLLIWQKGIQIVKEVYLVCKSFPKEEMYGLQSQVKRSSQSQYLQILQKDGEENTRKVTFYF